MAGAIPSASGEILIEVAKALSSIQQVRSSLQTLDAANTGGEGMANAISGADQATQGFTNRVLANQQALTTLGQTLTGFGLVATGAFGLATHTAMNFDAQMSAVGSVANATETEFKKLREEALRLGATTVFSATESAQAMEIMLKAGANVGDVMDGATEHVMNLAAATGTSVPLAAEVASAAVNVFGIDFERAANVITQSSNASMLDVQDWSLAMKSVVPVANAAGMSIEDTAAAMMILADNGIAGQVSGTALRNIILNLGDDANKGTKAINELGIATRDASGEQRSMADITKELAAIWPSLTDAQRDKIALDLAGRDGVVAFNTVMDEQVEALDRGSDAFTENRERLDESGTAADGAAKRMDNLKGSLEEFFGAIEVIAIKAMTPLNAMFRVVVDAGTVIMRLFAALPAPVLAGVAALVGLAGVTSLAAGGFLLLLPRIAETKKALDTLGVAAKLKDLPGTLNRVVEAVVRMPGPIGRASTAMLNFSASARAGDYSARNLSRSLLNFVRLNPMLVGAGLVAGGLFLAYKTNFLGIGDLVDSTLAKVRNIGSAMLDAFGGAAQGANIAEDAVAQYAKATKVVDGITVWTAFRTNADGVVEEVGEIVESTESLDGKTTRVKIKGEDGEYWATIDLATGEISDAEIAVNADTRPLNIRINDALQVLEDQFAAAGLGWAAAIVNNLQGIVTWTASAAATIKGVFSSVGGAISSALGAVGIEIGSLTGFLTKLGTGLVVLTPIAVGLGLMAKAAGLLGPLIPVVTVAVKALGIALAVLTSPVGLVVVALAALAAAAVLLYKRWEPFQKLVDGVAKALLDFGKKVVKAVVSGVEKVLDIFDALADAFDAYRESTDVVTAALEALASVFPGLRSYIQPVISLVDRFKTAFTSLRDQGLNPVQAALAAVGQVIPVVAGFMAHISGAVDSAVAAFRSLWDAVKAFIDGDWAAGFEALGESVQALVTGLVQMATAMPRLIFDAFQAIDWGAAFDAARSAISDIVNQIRNVDWGGFLSGAWAAIKTGLEFAWNAITSINWSDYIPDVDWPGILGKAGDLGVKLFNHIKSFITSVDWMDLFTQAASLGDDMIGHLTGLISSVDWKELFSKSAELGTNLLQHLKSLITSVDWKELFAKSAELGTNMLQHLKSFITDVDWRELFAKSAELGTNLLGHLKTFITSVDWLDLFTKAASLANPVADHITSLIESVDWLDLFTKAGSLATKVGDHIVGKITSVDWIDLFTKAAELGTGLLDHITGLITSVDWTDLFGEAINVAQGLLDWIKSQISIPDFPGFPTPSEILDAIVSRMFGGGGNDPNSPTDGEDDSRGNPDPTDITDDPGLGQPTPEPVGASYGFSGGNFAATIAGMELLKAKMTEVKATFDTSLPPVNAGFAAAVGWPVVPNAALAKLRAVFGTTMPGLSQTTEQHFSAAKSSAVSNAGSMKTSVGNSISEMSSSASRTVGAMALKLIDRASSMTSSVKTEFMNMNTAAATQTDIMNIIVGAAFTSMVNNAKSSATALQTALSNGARSAVTAVRSGLSQIPGIVSSVGGQAVAVARSIGANISSAFASGMRSALGDIRASANAMVAAASSALVAKALISSPSRLFMGYGSYVGEGFELGILGMIPQVARAVAALVDTPHLNQVTGAGFMPAYYAPGTSGSVTTITYGDLIVQQQPGEDTDRFVDRVLFRLENGWDSTPKVERS